jgi:sugar O-acyltransferase (sialic acid O-acetyltransferase NeuD family)
MILVAGTGSFAAEIAEFARDAGLDVVGLIELVDPANVGAEVHGLPVRALSEPPSPAARAVIGYGADRRQNAARLEALGWSFATVIHPAAHVSPSAAVGPGTVIAPGVVVGAQAAIGANCLLARGALLGHHARLGDRVVLNPGANVGGNSELADDVFVGMGAVIVNAKSVGAEALVAAGAVVVRDVAAAQRVQGVPARPYP